MTQSVSGNTPRFTHDCDCCQFLGTHETPQGPCDLYAHTVGEQTVIARYSSEPADYSSGLCFAYGMNPVLTEARKRACAQGILPFDLAEALRQTTGVEAMQELQAKLPFTLEYQIALAYEQGNESRANGLLRHLLQMAEADCAKHNRAESAASLLLEIEVRIAQTVSLYRGVPMHLARMALDCRTEALWEQVLEVAPA